MSNLKETNMAATTQTGQSLIIGFNNMVYTGYIMQTLAIKATGEQTVIKDEDAATTTILISNLGTALDFTAIIKSTGSITPPTKGQSVTINNVVYRTEDASVKLTAGAAELTWSGIKEASMTYT